MKLLPIILLTILAAGFILTNQLHYFYPDEFDNILGGRMITTGHLPYVGFFSQHNPLPYFLAASITAITGPSFVKFRLLSGLLILIYHLTLNVWFRRRFGPRATPVTLSISALLLLLNTYDFTHMFLADSLTAYFLLVPFLIIAFVSLDNTPLKITDLKIISLCLAATVLCSNTQLIAVGLMSTYTLYLAKVSRLSLITTLRLLLTPYLIFFVYLLVTHSLQPFITQSIRYNTDVYVNLPDGASFRNPLRVLVVYFVKFFQSYKTVLLSAKDINLGYPFTQTLAVANAGFLGLLLIKKRFTFAVFFFLFLVYINTRGDPYTTAETDYQAAVYHFVAVSALVISIFTSIRLLNQKITPANKVFITLILVPITLYGFAFGLHLFDKWQDKTYQKFMGRQALIYDRPSVANLINDLVSKKDTTIIWPFDPENLLYLKPRLATRYQYLQPGMDQLPQMQVGITSDLETNSPPLLVFDTEFRMYGAEPGRFLLPLLQEKYTNLESLNFPCNGWQAVIKWYGHYDFERHFFFRKDLIDKWLATLKQKHLIKQLTPEQVSKIPQCH